MQAFSTIDKAALSGQLNKTTLLDLNKIETEFGHSYMYIIFKKMEGDGKVDISQTTKL